MVNVYNKLQQKILEVADGETMKIQISTDDFIQIKSDRVIVQTPMVAYELKKAPPEKLERIAEHLDDFLVIVKKKSQEKKKDKMSAKERRAKLEAKLAEKLK